MTFKEWAETVERGVTINPQMAFAAGVASRDAEIAELVEANRIACEDLIEQQNLRVTYAEQIAELVAALEAVIPEVAGGNAGLIAYNKCKAALAKVRKP